MGLYKRGQVWWMSFVTNGRQHCESTKTRNRVQAAKILNVRLADIIEGRFRLPKSNAPRFGLFAENFLESIRHPNTKKRYTSSMRHLCSSFGQARIQDVTSDRIDEFMETRLASGVRRATINRDLAVLRRMMNIAERKRLISFNPFRQIQLFEEASERRAAHILTIAEEEKLLAVAPDHLRVLIILILETGLRSGKEALSLKWQDVDFACDTIRVTESKTKAGVRTVPMSCRCRAALQDWHDRIGPSFSDFVFVDAHKPQRHLNSVRASWPSALKAAGLEFFWIYDLRHTFASRLTDAGVSPIFVAQIMGHSNPGILKTYARAVDESKRAAIAKLESRRSEQIRDTRSSENVSHAIQ